MGENPCPKTPEREVVDVRSYSSCQASIAGMVVVQIRKVVERGNHGGSWSSGDTLELVNIQGKDEA